MQGNACRCHPGTGAGKPSIHDFASTMMTECWSFEVPQDDRAVVNDDGTFWRRKLRPI